MALTYSEPVALGMPAPQFTRQGLLGTDGIRHQLSDFRYARALVIVFMCNHCPYVQAVQKRINELAKKIQGRQAQLVGICSNDSIRYPDDNFEAMQRNARENGFVFPYLWDETQEVARAYGAACTPDFYAFERERSEDFREADVPGPGAGGEGAFLLRYRGRLDDHWKDETQVTRRDLESAVEDILAGRRFTQEQHPSMGCSIKWVPSSDASGA